MSSEPVRQSTSDLVDFDVRKQSPEQIARICALWKERKRLESQESLRSTPPDLMPVPPVAGSWREEQAPQVPKTPRGLGGPIHYSTSFEEVLAMREPTLVQRVWNPVAPPNLARPHPPRRRSRTKWVLAGAASLFAMAAVAGGALWEQSTERTNRLQADVKPARDGMLIASPAEAVLRATPSYPMDIPMAQSFVATAVASAEADWPMQQAVDLALMTSAPVAETARLPLMPQLKPPAPVVQTASKSAQPQIEPGESAIARMELPLAASLTTATVSAPVAQVADARPDGPTVGFPDRAASSTSGASGSAGSKPDPGSGSAGRGGSGDPSGDTGGVGSESGGDPGDDRAGGSDSGGGAGRRESGGGESGIGVISGGELDGNSGRRIAESGAGFGGGKSGGGATGGDAGRGGPGGNGGGVAGGDDSGGGNSAEGGKSGEGAESGDGVSRKEGSTGARIGRGLGALGDALDGLGGPLGGEKGGAKGGGGNSNDKGK
ncbi:MAG TPA: hypothetical protein VJ790_03470 [Dongiaceae bacterium]|nr:hypothetical protein [Dongiaceae bacterium]